MMRTLSSTHFIMAGLFLFVSKNAAATECDAPSPDWLMCEDFEGGSAGWADWFSASPFVECNGCPDGVPDPGRIALSQSDARTGSWSLSGATIHGPTDKASGFLNWPTSAWSCVIRPTL